jgi:hypothetical protein
MQRPSSFFILLIFICSVVVSFSQTVPSLDNKDRIRLAEAFSLADKLSDKVWPNWSKAPFAVILVTADNEFLVRHPAPSEDFIEIGYDKLLKSKVYYRKRTFNQSFLATFPAVSGNVTSTIVVGQAENTWVKTSTPWVVTMLHEHFHQLQDSQPNFYQEVTGLGLSGGDQSGMWMLSYPFPYKNAKVSADFDALARQLAKALEAPDVDFKGEFQTYVQMHKAFTGSLQENDCKYLMFEAWKEGLARYTEYQIAKLAAANYKPTKKFTRLADYRSYAETAEDLRKNLLSSLKNISLEKTQREVVYPFGGGEALLLDRAKIAWKSRYFTEKFQLDTYFEKQK